MNNTRQERLIEKDKIKVLNQQINNTVNKIERLQSNMTINPRQRTNQLSTKDSAENLYVNDRHMGNDSYTRFSSS